MDRSKMPAHNKPHTKVKQGPGQASKFAPGSMNKAQGRVGLHNNVGAQMNTQNYGSTKLPLGTTKHGVGESPSYLKNPQNPTK